MTNLLTYYDYVDSSPKESAIRKIIDELIANEEIKYILLKHFKGESSVFENHEAAVFNSIGYSINDS
jgi:hypothetical protein